MLIAALYARTALAECENELRALHARDQGNQAIIETQRGELARLKVKVAGMRKKLKQLAQREGIDSAIAHESTLIASHLR
jgi:hypothetical protein